MKHRTLAMPEYVAKLSNLQLTLIGLQPTTQDDITICPLLYEDGSALSLVTMCIAKRGWFGEKTMLAVSIIQLDEGTRAVHIYLRELIPVPVDGSDMPFLLRYGALIKAMLVRHAKVSNMGKLMNLQRSKAV